ncbi:hypothetical protein ANCCAN_13029 [Ancylostoma caninum]|uniref:Calponin-homology (CH) domain-containing protein n=1 Tax=Ancylostoma caninum TaxID=29170 RepID=A0A368G9J4_ANCCA|nr:hypothetical protein ANCCAN_13029 [Ancylostoma caninum]
MPLFGLRISAQDEDERAQKNTFTRWINLHLEEHSSSGRVNDLFEDIKDGVLLCHLIEVLTGEALVSAALYEVGDFLIFSFFLLLFCFFSCLYTFVTNHSLALLTR